MSTERSQLIATIRACVDQLADLPIDSLDGRDAADQLLELDALAGRITGLTAQVVRAVEVDGWWAVGGARSLTSWLAQAGHMTYVRARSLVRLGRSFAAELAATGDAVVAGDLPLDHAQALVRHATTSDVRRDALGDPDSDCGEDFLLTHGRTLGADTFAGLVKRWAVAADPDADERGYVAASEREFVTIAETTDGMYLRGFLTMEHGACLRGALDALMTPPAKDDTRTTPQRRGQALADLARLTLEQGLVGKGSDVRPHLSCVVDYESLQRAVRRAYGQADDLPILPVPGGQACSGSGSDSDPQQAPPPVSGPDEPATAPLAPDPGHRATAPPGPDPDPNPSAAARPGLRADRSSRGPRRLPPISDIDRFAVTEILGGGTLPGPVLARLACDGEVSRLVFGPSSQLIDVGRAERTFSGPRRRAIVARDRTCRYPTCTAPPALGELHHVEHWADGGSTDANSGILLCWYHHDLVHRLQIKIQRSPSGGWAFITRHGVDVAA